MAVVVVVVDCTDSGCDGVGLVVVVSLVLVVVWFGVVIGLVAEVVMTVSALVVLLLISMICSPVL